MTIDNPNKKPKQHIFQEVKLPPGILVQKGYSEEDPVRERRLEC